MDFSETEAKRGAEILNISVELGSGLKDVLVVYEHDDPPLAVRNFFIKNNLPSTYEKALLRKVYDLIGEVAQDHALIKLTLAARPKLSTSPCKNYGEKLYTKGLERKEEFLVKNQMKRILKAKEIESTLRETPAINANSRKIANLSPSKSASISTLASPKASNLNSPLHSPRINKNSEKLAKKRVSTLYEDAEQRKKRSNLLKISEFPFKPTIKHKSTPSNPDEIVARLLNFNAKKEENIAELRKHLTISTDPVTGQQFFQPIIGRPPESRRSGDENIWESLYKQTRKSVEPQLDYPYSPTKLDGKVQTEKILLKKKIQRFSLLFQQLNPNSDGEIVFSRVNLYEIDEQIGEIMLPLLKELEETNASLNFDEFVNSMENLLKTLTPLEKNAILAKKTKNPGENVKSRHKKSASMASIQGVYTRQVLQQQKTQAKLELERKKKKKAETAGCTFRPSLEKKMKSLIKAKSNKK